MPIVIPTVDEAERMDPRQQEAVLKRLGKDRERAADTIAFLTGKPRAYSPFVTRAEIRAAMRRSAERRARDEAAAIVADARFLLYRMPEDPDAPQHVQDLIEAVR